jgi:hypothetical protein
MSRVLVTRTANVKLVSGRNCLVLNTTFTLERDENDDETPDTDAVLAVDNNHDRILPLDVAARVCGQALPVDELCRSGLLEGVLDYFRRVKTELAIERVLDPSETVDGDSSCVRGSSAFLPPLLSLQYSFYCSPELS